MDPPAETRPFEADARTPFFFAGMGLPGLCGFWGEVWTVLAGFKYNHALGIISALAVVLTAGYILWAVQRVFFGVNDAYAGTPDITFRERIAAIPLVVLAILLGVYPQIMLAWTQADVMAFVDSMTDYSVRQFGTAARAVADAGVR